jgi:hypothetical protein
VRILALLVAGSFLLGSLAGESPGQADGGSCASWDVREVCCPAGCAARSGRKWSRADEVLRACMRGIGCSPGEVSGATVFIRCDCSI